MKTVGIDLAAIDAIIDSHTEGNGKGSLIAILSEIQRQCSYLPREALERVADTLAIPFSQVFGVSTFYKIFSMSPRGRHSVKVCLGTACHVKGAGLLLERLKRDLGVREGETTADGKFTLETVNCLGTCPLAPVVVVDAKYHGNTTPPKVKKILKAHEENGR